MNEQEPEHQDPFHTDPYWEKSIIRPIPTETMSFPEILEKAVRDYIDGFVQEIQSPALRTHVIAAAIGLSVAALLVTSSRFLTISKSNDSGAEPFLSANQ